MKQKYLIHRENVEDPHKYGLPQFKKYPMPDAAHVRSAIKFFNYVEPAHEEELAKAILKRMKEYGLTFDDFTVGEENRFYKYIPEKELAHHGILGQKWGVRRYQNADGTLTEAGKSHYGHNEKQIKKDLKKVEKANYFKKSTTFARTKTAREIYKNNKEELQRLRKAKIDASDEFMKIYDKEMSKHDNERHIDYEWEEISRECEKKAGAQMGDRLKEANSAYINKCKEVTESYLGDLYNKPIGSINGKSITVEHFISDALSTTMDDMFMRDLINGNTIYDLNRDKGYKNERR